MCSFDNIPHRIIEEAVAAEVADGNILRLVKGFLTAGVMEDGVRKPTTVGTPQGGVISPLRDISFAPVISQRAA